MGFELFDFTPKYQRSSFLVSTRRVYNIINVDSDPTKRHDETWTAIKSSKLAGGAVWGGEEILLLEFFQLNLHQKLMDVAKMSVCGKCCLFLEIFASFFAIFIALEDDQ